MYLFHRLRDVYETSPEDSVEYLVSQYVLLHIHKVNELTVGQIAERTSISKSAVSKFFKSLIFEGGFFQLRSALYFELQYLIIDDQILKQQALKFLNQYHFEKYLSIQDVQFLARTLYDAKRIILFGDESKKSYFDFIINYLIFHKKEVRFVSWRLSIHQKKGLENLNSNDVFILIDLENSLFNFFLKLNMSIEVYPHLEHIVANKIYIGQPSSSSHGFKTIGITQTMNIFSNNLVLDIFCAYLLLECIYLYNS